MCASIHVLFCIFFLYIARDRNYRNGCKTFCNTHCNTLQHIATHCNTLQHTATHCNTLQHTAVCTYFWKPGREIIGTFTTHSIIHTTTHTATHYNKLQHAATHCNTLMCAPILGSQGVSSSEWLPIIQSASGYTHVSGSMSYFFFESTEAYL